MYDMDYLYPRVNETSAFEMRLATERHVPEALAVGITDTAMVLTPTTDLGLNVSNIMEYERKRSRYLRFRTAQIILCACGLLGNGAMIVAWSASHRRTPIVALMTSLAVWDLGLLLGLLYYAVRNFLWWRRRSNITLPPWSGSVYSVGDDPPMYAAIFAVHCFMCASVFTVLLISIVRYIAVRRPLQGRSLCSRRSMLLFIGLVFISAAVMAFCFTLHNFCLSFTFVTSTGFCQYVVHHRRAFSYPYYVIIGMIPWMGTIPLSVMLIIHVIRIPKVRKLRRGPITSLSMEHDAKRVTLQVILMLVLSAFTYPVTLNIFLAMTESPNWPLDVQEKLYLTSDFLLILNSIAHIFLFYIGGKFFRDSVYRRMLLLSSFCRRHSDMSSTYWQRHWKSRGLHTYHVVTGVNGKGQENGLVSCEIEITNQTIRCSSHEKDFGTESETQL